jgi:UDP-glucuronate decarboxylase
MCARSEPHDDHLARFWVAEPDQYAVTALTFLSWIATRRVQNLIRLRGRWVYFIIVWARRTNFELRQRQNRRSFLMHLEQRILVTGGSGFLGSHLCDRLLAKGANVICVDNFFSGARSNVEHLIGHKRFELIRHDVTFPLYIEVDQIYNLACPASPIHYQRDPVQTTKTSVHGAINMLGLAKRVRAKILQASTSEIYGDPNVHPQTEEYWGNVNSIGPRSCYDEGKRCAETLFFDYRRQHNLRIKVARIFNTYGPRMHPNDGRVVSNFIVQALLGNDITIYGDGSQTRSFCYVDDLIDGLIRLMESADSITGPINIGNPTEFTILQLASRVIEFVGSRSRIVHRPLPQDDPRQRRPDISKAQEILSWSPDTALAEGLRRTIAYFQELLRDQSVRGQLSDNVVGAPTSIS